MRILIATSRFHDLAGAEITALEIAEELLKYSSDVTIASFDVGGTLQSRAEAFGINLVQLTPDVALDKEWDLVWVFHPITYYMLFAVQQIQSNIVIYSSWSHFEPLESPPIRTHPVDLFTTNSHEHFRFFSKEYPALSAQTMVLPNSVSADFFDCLPLADLGSVPRIAIVSNHPPPELLDAASRLRSQGRIVDLVGSAGVVRPVTPDLLRDYNVVVSIGKTVPYCLALQIPVFCYDRFGGPGWITPENVETAAEYNFSGRCCRSQLTGLEIAERLESFADIELAAREGLRAYASSNFDIKKNILGVLERAKSAAEARMRWSELDRSNADVLTETNILSRHNQIILRERQLTVELHNALDKVIDSLIIDRDAQKASVEELRGVIETLVRERDLQRSPVDEVVKQQSALIENLRQTIESVIADRDYRKAGVEQLRSALVALSQERDEQVLQLNHVVVVRDGQIANLRQTVESLVLDRDSQKAGVEQLQDAYTRLSQERDEQVLQLNHAVVVRDGQIADLRPTVESLVLDRDSQKVGFLQLQDAFTHLSQERDEQVLQLKHVVAERDARIKNVNTELSALYNSKSWRLTSPLRKLIGGVSKLIVFSTHRSKLNSKILVSNNVSLPDVSSDIFDGERTSGKESAHRILLVSHYCPTRAHAGGLRILDIYALIRKQCPGVQVDLLTYHRPSIDWSLDDVYRIFHNVYLSPVEDLTPAALAALRGAPLTYDVVDLQFHPSGHHIDEFRYVGRKILFTPMESAAKVLFLDLRSNFHLKHFMRLRRFAALTRAAAEEIVFTQKVDEVVCVSRTDSDFLRAVTSSPHICGIETGVSQFEFEEALAPDYEAIRAAKKSVSILYVAYFGSETNVQALLWYIKHVHPLVKARVPEYVLTVVGRGDLSPFSECRDKSIEFVGEVPAIAPYIKEARVSIAPALGGSGFRGKVNQYAVLGCPCVVSPIAFKGLLYQDGVNIFIAKTPEIFADRCIQLLTDLELNDRMGQAARQLCMERYSWSSKWAAISKIYELQGGGE